MSTEKKYKTFWAFYPYYLTEHQDTVCRTLHFIGTGIVIGLFFTFLYTLDWRYFAAIPFAGYGFAWVGHFAFEKNKPATFQYPLYSLGSDFVMFWHIITFQLPAKMAAARKEILG
jgi:hypothetical protein